MSSIKRELGPSLVESLGIFVLAYLGSDALFALEIPDVGGATILFTSLAIAIGFLLFRLHEAIELDRAQEDARRAPIAAGASAPQHAAGTLNTPTL